MSNHQQGPGWWLANDGQWYPPAVEDLPGPTGSPAIVAPPPPGYALDTEPRRGLLKVAVVVLLALVVGLAGLVGFLIASDEDADKSTSAANATATTEPELTKTQAEVDALMAEFTGVASAAIDAEGSDSYYELFDTMNDKFRDLAGDAENIDLGGDELEASRAIGGIGGYLASGSACELAGERCNDMNRSIKEQAVEALEILGPHSSLGAQMFIDEL